ncbi:MAG: zinc-binding dehydrogenase [Chloroflexi bacterium]|nr:zinc-binding dehydrogenase [Chloroflexota bacterium]
MRAVVIVKPKRIEIENVAMPELGTAQVLLRIEGCGVCASNLPLWQGRAWFSYPLAPGAGGHEGWGRIQAVGRGVRDWAVGERVAFLSDHAYAEYDVAEANALVKLPPALDSQPFPGEPLGCAMNVLRRSDIQPGQTVAIVGIGFLGALLTRLAAHAGARVLAISRRAFALEIARKFGAAETIPMDDAEGIVRRVQALTDGRGCERVVEAIGLQRSLDLATVLTRDRGRLVIAGYHQDGPRQVNIQLWNWRGLDVINAHERDPQVYVSGMRAAVDAVSRGVLDPSSLYTSFPLEKLSDAFQAMETRPDGFVKALVTL